MARILASFGNLADVLALQAQELAAAARAKVVVKPSQAVNDDRKSAASGQGTADQPGMPRRGGRSAQRRLLEAERKTVMWGFVPQQGLAEAQAGDALLTKQAEQAAGEGGHAARSQAQPVAPNQPGRSAQQQQMYRGSRAPDDKHGLWEYVPEQAVLTAQEEDFDDLLRQADLMEPELSQAQVSKASQLML